MKNQIENKTKWRREGGGGRGRGLKKAKEKILNKLDSI